MAYCTEDDLRALLDGYDYLRRDKECDFSAQIAMAETWVDARLEAAGVEVPLSSPPAYISLAAANYAAYLITRRPNTSGDFDAYSESFRRDAESLVSDFVSGKADIPGRSTLPKRRGSKPTAVNPDR